MTDTLAYLSPQWRDEAEKRLQTELPPEKMKFIDTTMSNIYKNCPDGQDKYLFFKCEQGRFTQVLLGIGEPPQAEFKITGDYHTFALISQSKLKSQKALMTGKLKLKGNMVKALKLAALADRMNKVLSTIPATY